MQEFALARREHEQFYSIDWKYLAQEHTLPNWPETREDMQRRCDRALAHIIHSYGRVLQNNKDMDLSIVFVTHASPVNGTSHTLFFFLAFSISFSFTRANFLVSHVGFCPTLDKNSSPGSMPADTCVGPCAQLLHFAMPLDTFKVRSTTGGNTRVARCADAIQGVPDGEPGAWTLATGLSDVYSPLGQGPSLRRGKI